MSHISTPQSPGRGKQIPIVIAAVVGLLIGLTAGARALGIWPDGGSDAVSVEYITEAANGATQGVVDSPLTIRVRIPWSTGSADTIISGVAVQMLNETNVPARFGNASFAALDLKPTSDVEVWEWRGSIPSDPGKYHASVQIKALYNEARTGITELPSPVLESRPEMGTLLESGYVFARNSNLWLLATDISRQRRLTYFPEFYEYADKPQWSPDGSTIAFTYSPRVAEGELPATEIWSVAPGGPAQPLVSNVKDESLLDPTWSPDGQYLYYSVDNSSSATVDPLAVPLSTNVYIERMEIATGIREQWAPAAQMPAAVPTTGDIVFLEYVTPTDGLEGSIAQRQRIMRASADGASTKVLIDETVFQLIYAPSVSPDGKWVVFAALNIAPEGKDPFPTTIPFKGTPAPGVTPGMPGGNLDLFVWLGLAPRPASAHILPWDIFMVSTEGGAPIRLTTMDEDQPYPIWLNNETVAFMGATGLYTLGIDPSGKPIDVPTRVHEGAIHGGLTWRGP